MTRNPYGYNDVAIPGKCVQNCHYTLSERVCCVWILNVVLRPVDIRRLLLVRPRRWKITFVGLNEKFFDSMEKAQAVLERAFDPSASRCAN